MCGIVGYTGPREAVPVLLDGLLRLEYRGYDSAGLTVATDSSLATRKLSGRVDGLRRLLASQPVSGRCGIAHTRWATHGAPTEINAHPHRDCTGNVALVHNGIVENAEVLRGELESRGHQFVTETDTEVLAHLIECAEGDTLEQRVSSALKVVQGTYGLAVMDARELDKIVVARMGSPVLLGLGAGEFFVASDAGALLEYTRAVVYLNDGDIAVITPRGYRVVDREAHVQVRPVTDIEWSSAAYGLGGYPHYMLKEINEQPDTVRNVLRGRLVQDDGTPRLNGLGLTARDCSAMRRIVIVACGTSWHSGLVGRVLIEELAGIPVEVEYASEFRYRTQLSRRGTLAVAISQSGETADTLEALRAARAAGARVIGLVNVVGSTIAREADGGIYLHAGPEIGVASTKAFTAQIMALFLLGLFLGRQRGRITPEQGKAWLERLTALPDQVARTLELDGEVKSLAQAYVEERNALYLGRGVNFPVALEGALKLKEISYVHAEGYPAAEMKHGPIALIDEDMPVIFLAPKDQVYPKVLSNMEEVKARGGRIIAVTSEGNGDLRRLAAHQLRVPDVEPLLSPLLTVIPLQLFAYHIAALRGCDVDRPRNLAKSVTVE